MRHPDHPINALSCSTIPSLSNTPSYPTHSYTYTLQHQMRDSDYFTQHRPAANHCFGQQLCLYCHHAPSRMVSRTTSKSRHHRPVASDESGLAYYDGKATLLIYATSNIYPLHYHTHAHHALYHTHAHYTLPYPINPYTGILFYAPITLPHSYTSPH